MPHDDASLPHDLTELDDLLSEPPPQVIEALAQVVGDIVILGVGGKMGPTLARMAKRASDAANVSRRIIGVSRFATGDLRQRLEQWGIETVACDLLDEAELARLPDVSNVVFMAGFKFGATAQPSLTWAMNCYLPALVSRRYRHSRITAFSSGNVYGLVPVAGGGSIEADAPCPTGEYAMTVLGRERMLDYFSRELSIPMSILRLNYATELRYGVLVDLAQQVWAGHAIDVTMGYVNVIWQADANAMALVSLLHTSVPPRVLNIAGSEILCVREVCETFGRLMQRELRFTGEEQRDALLNNAGHSYTLLGEPTTPLNRMLLWTAEWVMRGGASLGKATHFESRDGTF